MDTVLDLPAPTAGRLRRPGWRDPRLLVGVALIAASVVLGSWAVTTAQRTVPVYVARDVLPPGAPLTSAALVVADVRLGDRVDGYLRADRPLPQDDPKQRRPDISKAKSLLSWEPTVPLDAGLERTIAYFRNRFF